MSLLIKNWAVVQVFSHVMSCLFLTKWKSRKSNSKFPTTVFLRFLLDRVFQNKNFRITLFCSNTNRKNAPYIVLYTLFAASTLNWTVWEGRDKWFPVTTVWRVLRLRMEKRSTIWRVDAKILKQQSRTSDMRRSHSLGVGRGANNSST